MDLFKRLQLFLELRSILLQLFGLMAVYPLLLLEQMTWKKICLPLVLANYMQRSHLICSE